MPIKKKFTFEMPDEPWIPTRNNNLTVDLMYTGLRYHVFSVENDNNKVFAVEWSGDRKDQGGDPADFVHDGHSFYLLDAAEDPKAASFLTGDDKVITKVPDYTFEVPNHPDADGNPTIDNEDFLYEYPMESMVRHCFKTQEISYDAGTKAFTYPGYNDHSEVIDKEVLFASFADIQKNIEDALADSENVFDDDDKKELEDHVQWLKDAPTVFADIDTWKIPYPTIPQLTGL